MKGDEGFIVGRSHVCTSEKIDGTRKEKLEGVPRLPLIDS